MVSRNTPSHLKLQNWDNLRPDEPLGKLHLPLPMVLTEAGAHDEGQWGRSHIIFPIRRRWVSIFSRGISSFIPPSWKFLCSPSLPLFIFEPFPGVKREKTNIGSQLVRDYLKKAAFTTKTLDILAFFVCG